ncbi:MULTISPECIES: hypothetical protein [Pseudomonas]|uniref:hypothetical protein n=1 Tax=Pseudomonas TaxID=286 RepID=UPI000761C197|nr:MULTISPECIES: hypothetical protein [Pseudomonas]MBA6104869.1 hypothetical protein [Pseudomonas monteilii]
MLLDALLAEYDESRGSELIIDHLGLQVIWSEFSQQIFQNHISSIFNDICNFTLNLFSHFLIKSLVEDDSVAMGSGQKKTMTASATFALCLPDYLENLYVYSVFAREQTDDLESTSMQWISKARR